MCEKDDLSSKHCIQTSTFNVHDNISYTQQNSLLNNYEDFANKAVLLYYGAFVKSDIHPIQCFTNIVY